MSDVSYFDETPAEAEPDPFMAGVPTYVIADDAVVSTTAQDGSKQTYAFSAGLFTPENEDEWFVIEQQLLPLGIAERAGKE